MIDRDMGSSEPMKIWLGVCRVDQSTAGPEKRRWKSPRNPPLLRIPPIRVSHWKLPLSFSDLTRNSAASAGRPSYPFSKPIIKWLCCHSDDDFRWSHCSVYILSVANCRYLVSNQERGIRAEHATISLFERSPGFTTCYIIKSPFFNALS